MPKVSIVLPTYNGEEFLRESIESVLIQSFSDWELIIVDDCSKDGTGRISDEYASMDSRIKVEHNKTNQKLPMALNIGFHIARGQYLTWTSDDNCYLREAISTMVNYLDKNKDYDMVCTNMLFLNQNWTYLREHTGYQEKKMYLEDSVGASFMYRRELLKTVGEYDPEMFCVEDYEYWIRILKNGHRIGYIDGVYYLYRLHENSLTVTKKEKVAIQRRVMYKKHFDWIINGIKDDTSSLLFLYGELLRLSDIDLERVKMRFVEYLPLLNYDYSVPDQGDIYIYGAGQVGRTIVKYIKNRNVKAFVDKNVKLEGSLIETIPVINQNEFLSEYAKKDNIHVIVAVGEEKQFEVIQWLVNNGIKRFSVGAHIF